jgi:uncharacterized membrane protein YbhN (UPF0104 family)
LALVTRLLAPFSAKASEKAASLLGSFISGVRMPAGTAGMAATAATSFLIWGAAIWPIDLLLRAFGVELPLTASMFIMVFLVFAVMVPASPGFVGTYHLACVTALSAFDIVGERALSIAIVIHALGFLPVIPAGLFCLWRDKLSLKQIGENNESGART